jgi:pimeloyl-ACP methyl ester carboxylesterase
VNIESKSVSSSDGVRIAYERTGTAPTALVCVHGWLGSGRWWDAQRDAFASRVTVVTIDLAGHGASSRDRQHHSAEAYVADIAAVVNALDVERVVLVGHSMSGAYTTLAAPRLPRAVAVVLVDTLKNVEQQPAPAELEQMFAAYRRDFRTTVEQVAPQWLFTASTPPAVRARVTREFLERTGDEAASLLEPLYRVDLATAAERVTVPVRAINSDPPATDVDANRRHFRDFAVRTIPGVGHYPMLEAPDAFNTALASVLAELDIH